VALKHVATGLHTRYHAISPLAEALRADPGNANIHRADQRRVFRWTPPYGAFSGGPLDPESRVTERS